MQQVTIEQAFELALQHHQAARLTEAESIYRRILEVQPNHANALHYLGVIAHQLGRHEMAVELIGKALLLDPENAFAHTNLGGANRALGRLNEAKIGLQHALRLKPGFVDAQINLANTFKDLGEHREAIALLREVLRKEPNNALAHYNLGNTCYALGQLDDAITAFEQALRINPDCMVARSNLGSTLKDQGRIEEAMLSYRRALQTTPDHSGLHSNIVYLSLFLPSRGDSEMAREAQLWNRKFGGLPPGSSLVYSKDPDPERPLRIGYVSPEFRDHVTGRYLAPLLRNHDHREFEILCYSGAVSPDARTEEFRGYADLWRNTVGVSDEVLAEMIRQDGVDVLVDLTQHLDGNRLPVFARRPAPVQVSFAGYPESTGLDAIGCRISDPFLELEGRIETRIQEVASQGGLPIRIPPSRFSSSIRFGVTTLAGRRSKSMGCRRGSGERYLRESQQLLQNQ